MVALEGWAFSYERGTPVFIMNTIPAQGIGAVSLIIEGHDPIPYGK